MPHAHRLVADRMQAQVEKWHAAGDRRAVFLNCYLFMTRNMVAALDAGEFHDPEWVGTLLDHFAGYYFDALASYEQGDAAVPIAWRTAHDAARRPGTAVLQDLGLGINAHISYDLVLALGDMMAAEWATYTEDLRRQRYEDYLHVNAVLARTIDAVQDQVETLVPWLKIADVLLGRLDEDLTSWLITHWRDEVWAHAVRMIETSDPAGRESLRQQIESLAVERARAILLKGGLEDIARLV